MKDQKQAAERRFQAYLQSQPGASDLERAMSAARTLFASEERLTQKLTEARFELQESVSGGANAGTEVPGWEYGVWAIRDVVAIHQRYLRSSGDPAIVAALCSRAGDLSKHASHVLGEFTRRGKSEADLTLKLAVKDSALKTAMTFACKAKQSAK